jgi:hypothetical protein
MPSLPVVAKLITELSLILTSLIQFSKTFDTDSIKEDVDKYEKLRRDAVSRHLGKAGRNIVYKDTKPRPAILQSSCSVLSLQNGVNDEGKHQDVRQRVYTRKHVCNEPGTVRTRQRVFYVHNGRRSYSRIPREISE